MNIYLIEIPYRSVGFFFLPPLKSLNINFIGFGGLMQIILFMATSVFIRYEQDCGFVTSFVVGVSKLQRLNRFCGI